MGTLAGGDLHHVAVLQAVVQLHNAAVDLGRDHGVTHGGMDIIGKVDGRSTGRQVDDIALRGKDEDLVGEHIHFQGVDILLGVGALLILQQAAHPLVATLFSNAATTVFILPVGGDTVLRHLVHLVGADLHLEGDAVVAQHRGVKALVHIGLGGADIVLESAQNGLIHIVDDTQHIVAVRHFLHDDAEGKEVKDIVKTLVLGIHLAVNAVGVLGAAVDHRVGNAALFEAGSDLTIHFLHEGLVLRRVALKGGDDFLIADGVEVLEAQILQLPLHLLHTKAMGDGGIDLHGLEGLLLLLGRSLILHGAHIVETVGDLHQDNADILAHGQQHLPQVLHLLLFLGGIMDAGQLADALYQVRHRGGEHLRHLLMGSACVLDGIVEQCCHDRFTVETQLIGDDAGHCQRMGHEGRAVLSQLGAVIVTGKLIGLSDLGKVGRRVIATNHIFQILISFFQIC